MGLKWEEIMRNEKESYLSILKAELKDLQRDIEFLIEQSEKEKEAGKITNYVFMENLALFRNELLSVNAFDRVIDETDITKFDDLPKLIDHLKDCFRAMVKDAGLAKAINIPVERKMNKVADYVLKS